MILLLGCGITVKSQHQRVEHDEVHVVLEKGAIKMSVILNALFHVLEHAFLFSADLHDLH